MMARMRVGIAGRLVAAVAGLAALTIAANAVSSGALLRVRAAFDGGAPPGLPAPASTPTLAQQSQSIVATAPALVLADNHYARETVVYRVDTQLAELDKALQQLRVQGAPADSLDRIGAIGASLRTNLHDLNAKVEAR